MSDEATVMTEQPSADIEADCSCRPPDVYIPEADHSDQWPGQTCIKFFPDHFISEATAMVLLLCLYAVLAILWPAPLEAPANPLVTPVGIKPEWYFLFLYSFLHYVPVLVGVLMPLVGIVILILLPWIDRNPSRKPSKRPIAIGLSILLLIGIVALTIIGLLD